MQLSKEATKVSQLHDTKINEKKGELGVFMTVAWQHAKLESVYMCTFHHHSMNFYALCGAIFFHNCYMQFKVTSKLISP